MRPTQRRTQGGTANARHHHPHRARTEAERRHRGQPLLDAAPTAPSRSPSGTSRPTRPSSSTSIPPSPSTPSTTPSRIAARHEPELLDARGMSATPSPRAPPTSPSRGAQKLRGCALRTERASSPLAAGLVGLHLVDDNYLQPGARRRPRATTSPAGSSRSALLALAAVAYRALPRRRPRYDRAPARHVRARRSARPRPPTGGHGRRRRATTTPACSALPAGLMLLGLGIVTLWRSRRLERPPPAGATPAGRCSSSQPRSSLTSSSSRSASATDHPRDAAERARGEARHRLRGRLVHDERRPRAPGLVRPLEERRRRDRLPRPQRPAGAHADARPPRLRRAALRPPRRRRERRRQQPVRLGRRQGHPGRDRVPQDPARTSSPAASAGSASPSAAS